jgi:hypothetical protein
MRLKMKRAKERSERSSFIQRASDELREIGMRRSGTPEPRRGRRAGNVASERRAGDEGRESPAAHEGTSEAPATAFKAILDRLVSATPGALGAVLVDAEGEAVDCCGRMASYDLKLIGAHFRVVLEEVRAAPASRARCQLTVRAARRSFFISSLSHGYALAVALARGAFSVSPRALQNAEWELAVEAGWLENPAQRGWRPVDVESTPRNVLRPARVRRGSHWESLDVLGTVVGLGRDRGYRCRLQSGAELTLVREPAGTWYADESVEAED